MCEGVPPSCRGVRSKLRTDLARQYLNEEDLAISQIAWLLTFATLVGVTLNTIAASKSFINSFHYRKAWSGMTNRMPVRDRPGALGSRRSPAFNRLTRSEDCFRAAYLSQRAASSHNRVQT
jgi:hypothetical protein